MVKLLPSAQVIVSGSWDQTPHWAPCSAGNLRLPLPLPLLVLSLSLSQINKILKKLNNNFLLLKLIFTVLIVKDFRVIYFAVFKCLLYR